MQLSKFADYSLRVASTKRGQAEVCWTPSCEKTLQLDAQLMRLTSAALDIYIAPLFPMRAASHT